MDSMKALLDSITVNTQSSIRIEGDKVIYFDPFKTTEHILFSSKTYSNPSYI